MRLFIRAFIFMGIGCMWAMGQEKISVQTSHATVELISDTQAIVPGQPFWVAVKFTMNPGWHIYWRNSGDSGMPTQITWQLPHALHAGEMQWPSPEKIRRGGMTSFGYTGTVYHLMEITPAKHITEPDSIIEASVHWLACGDVCVPETATLTLRLPVATKSLPSAHAARIKTHQQRLPKPLEGTFDYIVRDGEAVVRIPYHKLEHATDRISSSALSAPEVYFFPYESGGISYNAAITYHRTQDFWDLYIPLDDLSAVPTPLKGVVQIGQGAEAVSFILEAEPGATLPMTQEEASHLSIMSGYVLFISMISAFVGGLILNVMPCVFPILSLKILGLQQERLPEIRSSAFFYTLGVLSSFAVLAICLIALRMAGESVGWGFQMQSPVFVSVLIYVFVIMGLGLSGFIYFPMLAPATGGVQKAQSARMQNFLVGVLAVCVATPCTAPFMGAAMGVALTQSSNVMLLIFLCLGLGFAAPYAAVAYIPALTRYFPKPGLWMEKTKELLAFPMYLSAIWLMWILIQQEGARGFLITALGVVGVIFAIWLWKSCQHKGAWYRGGIISVMVCVMASPLFVLASHVGKSSFEETHQRFTRERLKALRERGKPVFVNVTAAWCLTCRANEFFLKSARVLALFERQDVTYLEADWTAQDLEITEFLETFQRTGVPFYVYFPTVGDPVILPQILSERILLKACTE